MKKEKEEFQTLLFKTAFCFMVCDGHIDERELQEIRKMKETSFFFKDIELEDELNSLLALYEEKGVLIMDELFESVTSKKLSSVQELLLLEVALRIVFADNIVDENELRYIRYLRSKLKLQDSMINERFGYIDFFQATVSKNIVS